MSTPLRDRITRLIATLAVASAIALPRAAAAEDTQLDKMRAKIASFVGSLMEKQGGSRIIYKVDSDALRDVLVTDLRDDVYKALKESRTAFSALKVSEGSVEVTIADANSRSQLVRKLTTDAAPPRSLKVTDGGDGLLRLAPADATFARQQHDLVEDAIAMVEQRLKDSGVKLASVQPDGTDRIRIFLPGVMDPERVTAVFARKVRVSFRMVDTTMPAEQAELGTPPAGSEVLFGFKEKRAYLVAKDSALDGDDIIYAGPGFATGTKDPVASFRFNGRGTRRLAHVTEENMGKPFAIVLDDKVISAPVIREPITGGSVQISGNFTMEEANSVAMLLHAGALPGRLALVEQQIVQPVSKP
ncbi:SecDF P1 head subdomain-containing protein [Bradyrhizobium sp. RDM4]|uniref:SecDF P1 head subdomain-containing protein n=1 Tax=Bradyrhizobium sp. RDM4 TaxID=3378765 RepID=UPI0038FC4EB7